MNVTAIGYQDRAEFSDTRPVSINILVSDLNHNGVANAHEDPSPSVPACSFLGSAALERKGLLATAATGAPAVRQHGGGRAHRALLTQQPSGRPTRSTGGEIKSLCCAAAGIIALATRPCGAHAYPLTGVRRAAHPAAPLRSTPRPHAQPVEGYGPSNINMISIHCVPNDASRHSVPLLTDERAPLGNNALRNLCFASQKIEQAGPSKHQVSLYVQPCSGNVRAINVRVSDQRHVLKGAIQQPDVILEPGYKYLASRVLLLKLFQASHSDRRAFQSFCHERISFSVLLMLLMPLLKKETRETAEDRPDRSNCPNPRSPGFTGIHCQHQNPSRREDQNHTGDSDLHMLFGPAPNALVPHPFNLTFPKQQPSLQSPCHHVQRGAA